MANFIVGLTGGIGSGKSAASKHFELLGIECVDADVVAREMVLPGSQALTEISHHFGDSVIEKNGALNRKKLREIIFHQPEEKNWLEQLLHPLIRTRIQLLLTDSTSVYTLLSSPLLIETKQYQQADRVLVVDIPGSVQIQRTMQRDESSESTIKSIIANQITREERLKYADDIIDNSKDLASLNHQIDRLHEQYLKLAATPKL